jgi:signal transduction histidine kinase
VEVNSTNLIYEGKTVRLATINDLTEKIKLEEKLTELKVEAQKQIAKAQIKTQEGERALLGRELHDSVNPTLTTARLYLDLARSREETRLELIEKSEQIILSAIQEIRSLSRALVPPILRDIDFSSALDALLDSYRVAHPFDIHLHYVNSLEVLSEDIKLTLYRILQEQLTNIIKYALAKTVWIEFDLLESSVCLRIKDDGVGFDTKQKRGGVGLTNIKNRVELFNGSMSLNSSPGQGCLLLVVIPCDLSK